MFNTVGLVCKTHDTRVAEALRKVLKFLRDRKIQTILEAESGAAFPNVDVTRVSREQLAEQADLVIVIGGDGTFLSAARTLSESGTCLLGINLGRLGFLADIYPSEMEERLDEIMSGRFEEEHRFLLRATVFRKHKPVCALDALNEVVVHKRNLARLLEYQTFIDGKLLASQRSDGLIVATPTGSTAYALSGGGPILHPSLEALVLVPIAPHTLSSRPIVVNSNCRIEIVLGGGYSSEAWLSGDGQHGAALEEDDRIEIVRKDKPLRLIHPVGHNHFAVLRAKLHWAREL